MLKFNFNFARVQVENKTSETFTAAEIKTALIRKNPILWVDSDGRSYFLDFCFVKNNKEYWVQSKNISNDYENFTLCVYE